MSDLTEKRVGILEEQMAALQARFPVPTTGSDHVELPFTTGYLPVRECYGKSREWQGTHFIGATPYKPSRKTMPTKRADWPVMDKNSTFGHHVERVLWYAIRAWYTEKPMVALDPLEVPEVQQRIWEEMCLDIDEQMNPGPAAKPVR